MNRRGQVTIYIIIGIIIVFTLTLFILFSNTQIDTQQIELSQEVQSVKLFVDSCIDSSTVQSALQLASQGGTLYRTDFVKTEYSDVPYYYYEGSSLPLSNDNLKKNLEDLLSFSLKECTNGFKSFIYPVEEDEISVEADIESDIINIDINYPLTIQTDSEQQSIENFKRSYDIRLGRLRQISNTLLNEIELEPALIPYSLILDEIELNGVDITSYEISNSSVVYTIVDEKSNDLTNIPLVYTFAIKLNESEINPFDETDLLIYEESDVTGDVE